MNIVYQPIGVINTPFDSREGMPIQPSGAEGIEGTILLNEELKEGLVDIEGFSHLILIYHFHKSEGYRLICEPFMDDTPRGVFSIRAPKRPNPIGISVVKLLRKERNILYIANVDMLDGTPLLDIKPYVPEFDAVDNVKLGWLSQKKGFSQQKKSDSRFV